MACSTQLTVTRREARTMLEAVKAAKRAADRAADRDNPDRVDQRRDLEHVRLMLVAALDRVSRAEEKSGIRTAA